VTSSLVITDPHALDTISLGAMLAKVSPEQYLSGLLNDQVNPLLGTLARRIIQPEPGIVDDYQAMLAMRRPGIVGQRENSAAQFEAQLEALLCEIEEMLGTGRPQ
jgi:hypothetical protein